MIKISNIISMYEKPVLGEVKSQKRFMALSVDRSTLDKNKKLGITREITKSLGNVDILGFIDESKLIIVESTNLLNWKKVKDLKIKNINKIIKNLSSNSKHFIGLEDPDIWNENEIKHVYFTIAFKYKNKPGHEIYLGHAKGNSLDNLIATDPVLSPIGKNIVGFKEVAISPIKSKKIRINLTEMGFYEGKKEYSIISTVKAREMGKTWKYDRIVLDPRKMRYSWCKGYLSPCCFINIKSKDFLVGIINGREKTIKINGKKKYGKFRPGLILFNPKTGEIPYISEKPLLEDPDATTITFASDFINLGKKGILYCHINDSFIRAFEINLKELKKYIKNLKKV